MDPVIESANVRGKIILFKDSVSDVAATCADIIARYRIVKEQVYTKTIKGFNTGLITDAQCTAIMASHASVVDCILDDFEITAYGGDSDAAVEWNLVRIGTTQPDCSAGIGKHLPDKTAHIFVCDTGCTLTCPDLNIVENRSFVRNEGDGRDLHGHGTAVASVAAARDNDLLSVGVAPGAAIHAYKVLDKTGVGSMSAAIAALEAAIAWKQANPEVGVIATFCFGAFVGIARSALDLACAQVTDVTIVCAAGNDAQNVRFYSPARAANVLTVGAYDKANNACSWSNHGSGVHILAPGANVLALYKNNKLATVSGTSIAAAHVAGAAALFLSRAPHCTAEQCRIFITDKSAQFAEGANPKVEHVPESTTSLSIFCGDL